MKVTLAARSEVVKAGAAGVVYTISPVLPGGTGAVSLAAATNANLTLAGMTIRATAPIGAGVSQIAIVREARPGFAVQYPVELREATAIQAVALAAIANVDVSPIVERAKAGVTSAYTVARRLGVDSAISLLLGTSGNLTLAGTAVSASAPLVAGSVQTAFIRETLGLFQLEYAVEIRVAAARPATPSLVSAINNNVLFSAIDGAIISGGAV